MKSSNSGKQAPKKDQEKEELPGYPHYPSEDDIYQQEQEETDLDPEDTARLKSPNEEPGTMNEKGVDEVLTGDDLDVPGVDAEEDITGGGTEDEENNYFSLGGDERENLEEDQGG